MKIFRKGRPRDAAPHNVNSGPPHISEIVRAIEICDFTHIDVGSSTFECEFFFRQGRVRKFYKHLGTVKYSFLV